MRLLTAAMILALPSPAAAAGAVAWSKAKSQLLLRAEAATTDIAGRAAMKDCRETGASDCKLVASCGSYGGHLAIAIGDAAGQRNVSLICGRKSVAEAKRDALAHCRAAKAADCTIGFSAFEDGNKIVGVPQPHGPSGAARETPAAAPAPMPRPVTDTKPYRWVATYKKVTSETYLMPSKGGNTICAKNGDPGTLEPKRANICAYINRKGDIPKWTNAYHVLSLAPGVEAVWKKLAAVGANDEPFRVRTATHISICRAEVDGEWFVGHLIDERTCRMSVQDREVNATPDEIQLLVVYPKKNASG
jgi:hypothetical protein